MSNQITTEGRVFTAQLMREMRSREKIGAGELHPGAKSWSEAFLGFRESFRGCDGPVKAGKIFARGRERLLAAHKVHGACYLNFFATRKRSGAFEVLTWEVAQHPISPGRYEGIMVVSNLCILQRMGMFRLMGRRNAFISWHALGRLYERWEKSNIEQAAILIGLIGIAGLLMAESEQHRNNGMNVAFEGIHCTGVMRYASNRYNFFDCLTVLPDEPEYARQFEQGAVVGNAVRAYIESDNADPRGYSDGVPVLPFTRKDYTTRELSRKIAS